MRYLKIGKVFSLIRNGASIKQDKVVDGIPITRIETIANGSFDLNRLGYASVKDYEFSEYYLQDGDILMSHINSVSHLGKVAIFENRNEKIIHGMNLLCLKTNPEILLPKFAFLFLRSSRFRSSIRKITKKSVNQASFNISNLKELEIPVPSLPDQLHIANLLSKAENLISQRKESIRLLDEFLKSTFLEMFGGVGKMKNMQSEKLSDYIDFLTSGSRGWAKYYSNSGSRFLRIQNVWRGTLRTDDMQHVDAPKTQEAIRTRVKEGDLLITITADLGRTAVVPENFGEAYINQHIALVRLKKMINPTYAAYYFFMPFGYSAIQKKNKSAVKAGLTFNDINSLPIIVPPLSLQTQFAQIVEKTEALKAQYQQSLRELENLYGSLSQRAFRGELSLKLKDDGLLMAAEPEVNYSK